MKILAIDSSGLVASVAIVTENETIASYTINYKKTHSQTLLPMIREIVDMTQTDLQELDAVAVAKGPGSFTGLRIGVATAKGLAMSLDKPVIGVPTLDALAYQACAYPGLICPMMDARRQQVYTGLYSFYAAGPDFSMEERGDAGDHVMKTVAGREPVFQTLRMQMAASVPDVIRRLNRYGRPVLLLGDGVPVYEQMLRDGLHVPYTMAPAYMNRQNAAALGALACTYFEQGRIQSPDELVPDYLRMSQAERERAGRQMQVRLLGPGDAKEVAALEKEAFFGDSWSRQGVSDTLLNGNTICFGAFRDGKMTGYILAYETAGEAEIARIAVAADARRQNVGTRLMDELLAYSRRMNIRKILLDVREGNIGARAFYKSCGFSIDGRRESYYDNPKETAVLMSRSI